jgi:hypothetical protein
VSLLAAVSYWTLWSETDLTAPEADACLADGPAHNVDGICAEALAALLKGIRDLTLAQRQPSETCTIEEAAEMTFDALPVKFEESNEEFAKVWLPWVRVGFAILQRDHSCVEGIVRRMREDNADKTLMAWVDGVLSAAEQFASLAQFLEAAHLRLVIACSRDLARGDGATQTSAGGTNV